MKGFNSYAFGGAPRAKTLVLNRRVPYPVRNFTGGRNGSTVEFDYRATKTRVAGLHLFVSVGFVADV